MNINSTNENWNPIYSQTEHIRADSWKGESGNGEMIIVWKLDF